jgi:hypothetical protein
MATASGTKAENFKTICAKDNMSLRKNNDMNLFSLEYMYENPNFEITSLLNVNLYNLLFQVNKDIIDTIEVTPAFEVDKTAKKDNNEYYVAPVYNYSIRRGLKVKKFELSNNMGDRETIVRCVETGKWFTLSWADIVNQAIEAGITED